MPDYLLGIDIGTTATKAVLLHKERGIVVTAQEAATLVSTQAGWAEEDPHEWWNNVGKVVRACLERAHLAAAEIAGVGVSGMVPTLILLDAAGHVRRPSIQQNDARSFREINEWRAQVDEIAVLARTGSAITQQSIGPKLAWLWRHERQNMERAAHVLGSYDYIVYRLTGKFSCERNWALESGLYDLHREAWDDALLALSGIDASRLGRIRSAAEIVGSVSEQAAAQTGLAVGTPVAAGSADHIASAFSAGVKTQGDLLVKLGGAGDIVYSLDSIIMDERLYLDYHVIPGKYMLNGCMAASGSIIKWFRQQFAPNAEYAALDEEAAHVRAGSDGLILLPYFLGEKTPLNDPLARGVWFGMTLSHTRAHVYRSILEGIAYGFRHHIQVLEERGLRATKARVTNGGADSKLWKQITADVLGIPLEPVKGHSGSSLGAAFIAGMATGEFDDWSEIDRFIQVGTAVEPNTHAHERYKQFFGLYRELYLRLETAFPALISAGGTT